MPNYDNAQILIRFLITITVPLVIIFVSIVLANSVALDSSTDILNIDLTGFNNFILLFGLGFAVLSFFALLYGFIIRRNIHG